ncbi:cytochrome P450 [Sphingomonas oryzagri]
MTVSAAQPTKVCPISFDHNAPDASAADTYRTLRSEAPVAWSDRNGGFWIVSGHSEVTDVAEHPEIFSSALSVDEAGQPRGGIFIPAEKGLVPMIPTEIDPPLWRDYRLIFSRHFKPAAVDAMRPMIVDLATKCINEVVESGRCDMVLDIAGPVPASGIIRLLDLDEDEWVGYGEPFHDALGYPPGSPEFRAALEGLERVVERIRKTIADQRRSPTSSFISEILAAKIEGEPITDDGATSVVYSLFSGGVDTTTTLLANAFAFLSRNPEAKAFLIANPDKRRLAAEEFIRWSSPVQALGRTVVQSTTLGGQRLEPGDRVLLAWTSANRDNAVFPEPEQCILDRYPNRHVGFGVGIHRCAGAHFARMQIDVILEQVLKRMPDFKIDEDASCQYPNLGVVNGWLKMPATFTPGRRA